MLAAAEQTVQLRDGASVKQFYFEPHDLPQNGARPPPLAIFIAGGSNKRIQGQGKTLPRERMCRTRLADRRTNFPGGKALLFRE